MSNIENVLGVFDRLDMLYEKSKSKYDSFYDFMCTALKSQPGNSEGIGHLRSILSSEVSKLSEQEYQEYGDRIKSMQELLNDLDIWFADTRMSDCDFACEDWKSMLVVISEGISDAKARTQKIPDEFMQSLLCVPNEAVDVPFRFIRYDDAGILRVNSLQEQNLQTIVAYSCLKVRNRSQLKSHIDGLKLYIDHRKKSEDYDENNPKCSYEMSVVTDAVRRLEKVYKEVKVICNAIIYMVNITKGMIDLDMGSRTQRIRITGDLTVKNIREDNTHTSMQLIAVA